MERWRVVLASQFPSVVAALYDGTRAAGHEPVAVVFAPTLGTQRPMPEFLRPLALELVADSPPELDVLVPATRARVASAFAAFEPDLVLCCGFPWRVSAEALAVPRLGVVNGHGAWLPDYRGPIAHAWTIRKGESEIGFTFHLMDEDFDTGPILARTKLPLADDESRETLREKWNVAIRELLPTVFARLASGDRGDPQEDGTYYPFFEPEYAQIDWSRPAREIHNQVRAWRFAPPQGPLAELDGRRVRVLRTRLEPGEGRRVECGDGAIWILETEPA